MADNYLATEITETITLSISPYHCLCLLSIDVRPVALVAGHDTFPVLSVGTEARNSTVRFGVRQVLGTRSSSMVLSPISVLSGNL